MSNPAKASLRAETGMEIPCMFNPAELKLSKSNEWQPRKGKGRNAPKLNFQDGGSGSLELNLVIDTTTDGSPVTDKTDKLLGLMKVDKSLASADPQRNRARPPYVQFCWGRFRSFKAVIERANVTFTLFSSEGVPLRAKVDLSLKQYDDDEAYTSQNPTSFTPAPHAVHTVLSGERLEGIAARTLGDPTRWRVLAEANGITDPFALVPGDRLVVPEMGPRSRG
jgi:Contractile injection system tube protein/LysM domain